MAATHFYTANATEWQAALLKDGFINEGVACYVYLQADGGLAPLFRLLHRATGAHFRSPCPPRRVFHGSVGESGPIQGTWVDVQMGVGRVLSGGTLVLEDEQHGTQLSTTLIKTEAAHFGAGIWKICDGERRACWLSRSRQFLNPWIELNPLQGSRAELHTSARNGGVDKTVL